MLAYSAGGLSSGPSGYGNPMKSPTSTASAAAVLRSGSMVSTPTPSHYGARGAAVSPSAAVGLYHTAGYHHQGFYSATAGTNSTSVTAQHRPSSYHEYTPR
jgi:hypothetical protein